MKFMVSTARSLYTEEQAAKLKKLGFTFDLNKHGMMIGNDVEIEISTLEELITFSEEWGEIIVSSGEIEIYNAYRES